MLAEISQIDFVAKVKYHGGCWAKYQTKVKSIFQRKSAKHQMMHVLQVAKVIMNGIKKEKSFLKLLMLSAILLSLNYRNVANNNMGLIKLFYRLWGVYLSSVTKCFTYSLFKMDLYSGRYQ